METGLKGMWLTLSGYLIPFGFVFIPSLLLRGHGVDLLLHGATAAVKVCFLSAAVMGYRAGALTWPERVLLVVGATGLFHPSFFRALDGRVGGVRDGVPAPVGRPARRVHARPARKPQGFRCTPSLNSAS